MVPDAVRISGPERTIDLGRYQRKNKASSKLVEQRLLRILMSASEHPSPTPAEEARSILDLMDGDGPKSVDLLERQLFALNNRAQILVSLSGVVITVTGFSGRLIAATDRVAQLLLVSGLAMVVVAAIFVWARVLRVRWISRDLIPNDLEGSLIRMLNRRNAKTRSYTVGGMILFLGLALYCASIALMLLNPGPVDVPIR